MRTIAILNLKGGVAKTTTAINTAHILASVHGKSVLLIDADSQCNLTEFMQRDAMHVATLSDLLRGKPHDGCIEASRYQNIDLLSADEQLMDLDLSKVEARTADAKCLKTLLQDKICEGYDHVIIDCPPAFNAASCAALIAADSVVIPMKLDAFSLRGMGNVMRQIRNMQRINPRLKVGGILPTMYYKDRQIDEAETALRKSGLKVYPHIRRTPTVDKMTFKREPILISSPLSAAAADYQKFAEVLINE